MANKVFISFLGTNNYIETFYEINGIRTDKPVRFIQEAILRLLYFDWSNNDKVLIFCTEKAKALNWVDNGHKIIRNDFEKIGLKSTLKILRKDGFKPRICIKMIKEGFSEDEIWKMFNEVYGALNYGDIIYFDITHAFRSIPFFSFALFNYSSFLKKTSVVSILYGAFEKLAPNNIVCELNKHERVAPIIELKSVLELQKFILAANNFIEYGRFNTISSLLIHLNNTAYHGKISKQSSLYRDIIEIENDLATCRGAEIKKGEKTLKVIKLLNTNINSQSSVPMNEILKKILESISIFKENSLDNLRAAVDWCIKYKMTQQAYTIGQESIITIVCEKIRKVNPHLTHSEKYFRELVSSLLSIDIRNLDDEDKWDIKFKNNRDLILAMRDLEWVKKLRLPFSKISGNRNSINHSGFIGDLKSVTLINQVNDIYLCFDIVAQNIEIPKL